MCSLDIKDRLKIGQSNSRNHGPMNFVAKIYQLKYNEFSEQAVPQPIGTCPSTAQKLSQHKPM